MHISSLVQLVRRAAAGSSKIPLRHRSVSVSSITSWSARSTLASVLRKPVGKGPDAGLGLGLEVSPADIRTSALVRTIDGEDAHCSAEPTPVLLSVPERRRWEALRLFLSVPRDDGHTDEEDDDDAHEQIDDEAP